jgi:hypothetical protein
MPRIDLVLEQRLTGHTATRLDIAIWWYKSETRWLTYTIYNFSVFKSEHLYNYISREKNPPNMKQTKSSPSSLSPHFDLAFSSAYKKSYKAPTTFAMRRTTTARICIVQYVQCSAVQYSMFGMVTYMNMANLA